MLGELSAVLVIVDINEVVVTLRLTKVFCPGHHHPPRHGTVKVNSWRGKESLSKHILNPRSRLLTPKRSSSAYRGLIETTLPNFSDSSDSKELKRPNMCYIF